MKRVGEIAAALVLVAIVVLIFAGAAMLERDGPPPQFSASAGPK